MARRSSNGLASRAVVDRERWRSRLPGLLGYEPSVAEADQILAHVERRVALYGGGEEVLLECDLLAEGRLRGAA